MIQKFYLIRHAEKHKNMGINPALTTQGIYRAEHYIKVFSRIKLNAIFASPATRAIQTVEPLANQRNLPIQPYDPSDPVTFEKRMKSMFHLKDVLVCGHQDSIPLLANTFLKKDIYESFHDDEFNILTIITTDFEKIFQSVQIVLD